MINKDYINEIIEDTDKTLQKLINKQMLNSKQAEQLEDILRSNLATLLEKEHPHC